MSLVLTEQQQSKVDAQKKVEAELPTYFNASLNQYTTISRDYESFLILQDLTVKTAIISWLSIIRKIQIANKDRDDLVQSAIEFEISDSQQKYDELSNQMSMFDDFKSIFQPDIFSTVPEVQLLVGDCQRPIDEIASRRDRTLHNLTVATYLQNNALPISDAQQKQMDSWNESLTAY